MSLLSFSMASINRCAFSLWFIERSVIPAASARTSTTLTFANELTLSDVVILTENQVSELSQEQRKHKLIERGFTEEDVKNMSNHTQITFLEANGIKASYGRECREASSNKISG